MLGVFIQKGILLGIPKNHYICKLKEIRTLSKMVRAQQKALLNKGFYRNVESFFIFDCNNTATFYIFVKWKAILALEDKHKLENLMKKSLILGVNFCNEMKEWL